MYSNPGEYLNGTSVRGNVTGYENHCATDGTDCARHGDPDSFLWYDELHPSEQANRILAKEFLNVASGKSKYATYWT
jgi:phospholipase/lecithinase/hemolysin